MTEAKTDEAAVPDGQGPASRDRGGVRAGSTRDACDPRVINVYADDLGWLFEDLKQLFGRTSVDGLRIAVSDQPIQGAAAWVALRTREAARSPDLGRTVVCFHDLLGPAAAYEAGGARFAATQAGAFVISHPGQRDILKGAGARLRGVPVLERPLGALSIFSVRQARPSRFTVGWAGRNHRRKRLEWFVDAMCELNRQRDVTAALMGEGLESAAVHLNRNGIVCGYYPRRTNPIDTYPGRYASLDAIVITSETEAGPLPLFEALATGLPVVSTPVGWAPHYSELAPNFVRLADTPLDIAGQLLSLEGEKDQMFARRYDIADLVTGLTLESWAVDVVTLAGSLAFEDLGLKARPRGRR